MTTCDHCGQPMHIDSNGWYVGPDETSDCPEAPDTGHQVDGEAQA